MSESMPSSTARLVDDARGIFASAVQAVQADQLLGSVDWKRAGDRSVASYDRVFVAGMGKASLAMASVLESSIGRQISDGAVVVPQGYTASLPGRLKKPTRIHVLEGGHPFPNQGSLHAAQRVFEVVSRAASGDLVIVLISGGGSALCADFGATISQEDAAELYRLLLKSGADIHAVNTVRKHISRVGGGRLAVAAAQADVLALIVSDVVGNDISVVASGPTTGDSSTFDDAKRVLVQADIWTEIPNSVRETIEAGLLEPALETPKPGAAVFRRVTNRLIATNETALNAAVREAERRGYTAEIIATNVEGEAREVGRWLGEKAREKRLQQATCLISGGEPTVTVRGSGKGGRNQEVALAAAMSIQDEDRGLVILSGGTDGVDGPTDAAGAWATPSTIRNARGKGLDPRAYLDNNDSYTFFLHVGGLLKTGHTHTNVMDVQLILLDVPRASTF